MIIYRVVLKVGYYERWFEFETLNGAGEFARTVLTKQVINKDHPDKPLTLNIELIDVNEIANKED